MKVLVVVDMQNDFIDGALGTREAVAIVPAVAELIKGFDGLVIATRDTHGEDYLETAEGKKLPVPHCIRGSHGWELRPEIAGLIETVPVDKPSFGSPRLAEMLKSINEDAGIESVTLCGLCTDICVISNAMLIKAFIPEVPISVVADCSAGVTPESHQRALEAMKACQIDII